MTTHRRFTRILGTAYKVVRVRASEMDPELDATVDHDDRVVWADERLSPADLTDTLAQCERAAQQERRDAA